MPTTRKKRRRKPTAKSKIRKLRRWIFRNDTWLFEIALVVSDDKEAAAKHISKIIQNEAEIDPAKIGMTWTVGGGLSVIWLPERAGAGIVSHEAFHATRYILECKGLGELSDETEEAYAYLLDWIVRQIGRRIW